MLIDWLRLFAGEWRRHWNLYLWLALGLVLAAALFNGVENLNRVANSSFAAAESTSERDMGYRLYSLSPGYQIPKAFWIDLRRNGIAAEPVILGQLQLRNGDWIPLRGQSVPATDGDNRWRTLVTEATAKRLTSLETRDGQTIPALKVVSGVGGWLVMDLAPAAALLGSGDHLSYLQIPNLTDSQYQWLNSKLGNDLQLRPEQQQQQQPMIAAFSLNLRALGVLSFVVGGLLVLHAVSSLVEYRKPRLSALSDLGASQWQLWLWTASELLLLSLLCGVAGAYLGMWLAQMLAPGVEVTLTMLYQADRTVEISWHWQQALWSIGLILSTLMVLLFLKLAPPRWLSRLALFAVIPLLATVAWLTVAAINQDQALLMTGLTIVLAILSLPMMLQGILTLFGALGRNRSVFWRWAVADLQFHRSGLSTALIAITLALATAVATRILTGSFAIALDGHLEQRLFALAYLRGNDAQLQQWQQRLATVDEVIDVKSLSQRSGDYQNRSLEVKVIESTTVPTDTFHFKSFEADWWQQAKAGQCLVNEPMALQAKLRLGQTIEFTSGSAAIRCNIAGIYFDYGNPRFEVSLERSAALRTMGELPLLGLGFKTAEMRFQPRLQSQLIELGIPQGAIYWQQQLLDTARALFARTFAITDALAWLTLGVAMLAWIASLLAQRRRWLDSDLLLETLGMTPQRLITIRVGQLTLLLLLTLGFASLLGVLLGWQLLAKINPLSFGWSMPIELFSGQWWFWVAAVLVSSLALALIPINKKVEPTRGEWQ